MTRCAQLALVVVVAACASCRRAEPPTGFGVNLSIDARALTAKDAVATLELTASGAETYTTSLAVGAIVRDGGVVRTRYVPGVEAGSLTFDVAALDGAGVVVGRGVGGPAELAAGRAVALDIALEDASAAPDLSGPDLASSQCVDGVLNGDETDVDCGGACRPCEPSRACKGDADCATGTCTASRCELASGPPSWVSLGSLPFPRAFAAAAALDDGKIYLLGGTDATDTVATTTYAYALETNDWTAVAPLSQSLFRFPAVGHGSTIWAIGGLHQTGMALFAPVATVDAFSGGTWSTLQRTLGSARDDHAATLGTDGRIYVAGGRTHPSTTALDTFESFSSTTDAAGAATPEAPLPAARFFASATTADNGSILVAGGSNGTATPLRRVDAYDASAKTWSSAPDLIEARDRHGAALGADGRVYVVGGAATTALRTVEALSNDGQRWVPAPTLGTARFGLAVTRGWDGRLYAIGGTSDTSMVLGAVEAYGPRIIVGPSSVQAGKQVAISGSNFAAKAKVSLTFMGAVVAMGSTNATGTIVPSLSWQVPAVAPGTYEVMVVDDRARYPVRTRFEVVP